MYYLSGTVCNDVTRAQRGGGLARPVVDTVHCTFVFCRLLVREMASWPTYSKYDVIIFAIARGSQNVICAYRAATLSD